MWHVCINTDAILKQLIIAVVKVFVSCCKIKCSFVPKGYPPTTIQGKSLNTTVNPTAATPTVSTAAAAPPARNPELEFPATNYYELESRVHTDQWTIPFRQDESLAICLRAAIKMLHHDVAYSDEQCISFMERTLPDAFFKVRV